MPARVPLIRLRRKINPVDVEHFYPTSAEERDRAIDADDYTLEGVAGVVYERSLPGTVPLVRLWHAPSRRHSLTAHPGNLAAALATGTFHHEGVIGYVFGTDKQPGTVPLYALVSRASNAHLYTTDTAERDAALAAGYEALGIACWLYPAQADRSGA